MDYKDFAHLYSTIEYSGTGYLVYRDLPSIFSKYVKDNIKYKAIDFGCGTADSTNILTTLDFDTLGVDINCSMLNIAKEKNKLAKFKLLKNNSINSKNNNYDFALSCLVFMEVETIEKLISIFKEIYRVLKCEGIFIFVVATKFLYDNQWITIFSDYTENKNLFSGKVVKILLTDINLEIKDYFWLETDYDLICIQTGFNILEKKYPLGYANEPFNWKDEYFKPPFVQYVLKKI